jgi:transcription initiation factor TFIID subunit 4
MRVGQALTSGPNGTVTVGQLPTVPISPNSMAIRAVAVTQSISTSSVAMVAPQRAIVTTVNAASSSPQTRPSIATSIGSGSAGSSGTGGGNMSSNMTPDTAKLKCKNFLATLLRLAGEQPVAIANNVRNLIQGLIDGTVEPEVFTNKLQKELNSSPQPCLVPFLKKSLPYLQNSLINGELSIEGVNAPSSSSTAVRLAQRSQVQLQGQAMKVQVIGPQGVQLPQRPVMINTVRTSNSQSIRPMLATTSQLRAPGLNSGIRPTPGMPKATIGYATVNRGGLQQQQTQQLISLAGNVKTNMPTFAGAPKVSSLAAYISSANAMAAANQPKVERKASAGSSFSAAGDEDINDVATMGGVNLVSWVAEVSKNYFFNFLLNFLLGRGKSANARCHRFDDRHPGSFV